MPRHFAAAVGTVRLTVFCGLTRRAGVRREGPRLMVATLNDVAERKAGRSAAQQVAAELVRWVKERSLSLTGSDGLLKQLTKTVLGAR